MRSLLPCLLLAAFELTAARSAAAAPAKVSLRWSRAASVLTFRTPELGALRVDISSSSADELRTTTVAAAGASDERLPLRFYRARVTARRTHGGATIAADFVSTPAIGGDLVFIPFAVTDEKRGAGLGRRYELLARVALNGTAQVIRLRRAPLRVGASPPLCAAQAPAGSAAAIGGVQTRTAEEAAEPTRHLELLVDVDSRFFKLYGTNTAAVVALVLRKVGAIYSTQLSTEVRLGTLTIYSDPATDPYAPKFATSTKLLERVKELHLSDGADLKHLFTFGRGFLDAIGLSYIATVCQVPSFTFGWDDYASGFDIFTQTVAHEIGHGFGASHDKTDPRSLMATSNRVNVTAPYFSAFSIAEVESYLSAGAACLDDLGGESIPDPGSVVRVPTFDEQRKNVRVSIAGSVKAGKGTLSGVVSATNGRKLIDRVIELRRASDGKLLATTLSDKRGKYTFRVKLRNVYFTDDRLSQRTSKFAVRF